MNYQERVNTRADVRALYEKVLADPTISHYRGYTATKSYGWNAAADDYCKRDGEVWFEILPFVRTALPRSRAVSCWTSAWRRMHAALRRCMPNVTISAR